MKSEGDRLLESLAALANPHRLRIIEALQTNGRTYVSQLAREIGISRPLLHLHLRKLEDAGLVTSRLELSDEGKALNFYEVLPFDIALTPTSVADAAQSLSPPSKTSEA
ncbi:ArsR/SmtB family transcription factor [Azospirillum picis]|uniref:DNA-binding transcriptional ArsR family regulator n=1 Tax=Azospirillum picis TaxID=488438 RepID=A0ABU0MN97_9PROT|nr:winged helix-turn-helix domain-containing protein [Azospirillum picis]MBP2301103.1 DNA-binding transcriptional ArsR family regulator [Azospirillum picis]MDQ0534935.1 DNA-binding transcriptional ArsR family regulator [Azospirillum picis]